jgi:threonine/homoserine efflux transporter RhtA
MTNFVCIKRPWALRTRFMTNAQKDDSMKIKLFGLALGALALLMYSSFIIKLW